MNKIILSLFVAMNCFAFIFAQGAVNEVKLTMVDGVEANISLFEKWKGAAKFIKENKPKVGSIQYDIDENGEISVRDGRKSKDDYIYSPHGFDTKNENEPGNLVNKDYSENANEYVIKICNVLKDSGCTYGIGYVDFGDKLVRYTLALKGKKLRVNRYNYYRESNIDYLNFEKEQLKKKQKTKIMTGNIVRSLIPVPSQNTNNKNFDDWLYKVRHETHEIVSVGSNRTGGIKTFRWRYIYRDNGKLVNEYVVDLNGYFYSDIDIKAQPCDLYSVPKDIRDLAKKSLN